MSAILGELSVAKMHGTHNEFLIVDERAAPLADPGALAQRWCDPASGLGADGLLVVGAPPPAGDDLVTMRIFNADGSEAEMCGNGIRCVARYLQERGAPDRFSVVTLAGSIAIELLERAPEYRVRADVGRPVLVDGGREQTIEAAGCTWTYRAVSLGNPHAVIFVKDISGIDVERAGAAIAAHPHFSRGTNVHFVQRAGLHRIRVRHYERGVGITQSCGTGAVASAVVAIETGAAQSPVQVDVPGGSLIVAWRAGESATLAGPAEKVFERTIAL
jgi:diaminopimelate epimerase